MEEYRTEEDKIIETMVIEGNHKQYDDNDFLPIRQSLYSVHTIIPEYDDEVFHRVVWCRPQAICEKPEYFAPKQQYNAMSCRIGTLPDDTFVGVLMAVAAYPTSDLIENIFASRPDDFKTYGIYTCRFYVEGEWVDVITDTNIPCLRDDMTAICTPVYTRSVNPDEMWVSLVEKAYAKAVGSYEAIPKVKIHEALLHLTGGSVQQLSIQDPSNKDFHVAGGAYKYLKKHLNNDTMILVMPAEHQEEAQKTDGNDSDNEENKEEDAAPAVKEDNFHENRVYSIIACRDAGGFELVLLHNPWYSNEPCWRGTWSEESPDWDMYPEVQQELDLDPSIPWTRDNPNGYFWMAAKVIMKFFNVCYMCKMFPSDRFSFYCVRGEWAEKTAGGAMTTIRDKATVATEAAQSRQNALQKSSVATVIDGDASWFNNPQYRVHAEVPGTQIYVSVLPASGEEVDSTHLVSLTMCSMGKTSVASTHPHLWDASTVDIIGTIRADNSARLKGQEASLWNLEMDVKKYYHVVVHTTRRALEGAFIVRIFSTAPIMVEKVAPLTTLVFSGQWDKETSGGPLVQREDNILKANPKWCQNPQFHLEAVDPYGKDEIFLKVVMRRTDKGAQGAHKTGTDKVDTTCGIVICKADCLEDTAATRKKNQPRQNALGELIASKESTLRKKHNMEEDEEFEMTNSASKTKTSGDMAKTILRKTVVSRDEYRMQSSFASKTEACVLYPRLPRSWMPDGVIIVPCLSVPYVRGSFDLEVYSSEPLYVNQLPESYSRSIAGEWSENLSGGSHINPAWKKNPKFTFILKHASRDSSCRVRITLSRQGGKWRRQSRHDQVGCMIGFYIFVNKGGELTQIYDSIFSPTDDLSTDPSFTLDMLGADEEYVIMPATYAEGKLGAFVLSIISEYEFSLKAAK